MKWFAMAAAILPAALFLPAQAMDIVLYDQMASKDRQAFLDFQSVAAERVLTQEGRSAEAAKVHHLFNDISAGSNLPLGEAELELNLDAARVRDAEKHAKNHDTPRVQVEAALVGTLSKNGVAMTPDFLRPYLQLTATFRPKFPPMIAPPPAPRPAAPGVARPPPSDDDPIGSGGFITPPR